MPPGCRVPADPRFRYKAVAPAQIPVDIYDSMARSIFVTPPKNPITWVLYAVKLSVAAFYFLGRRASIATSRLIEKQTYEREQAEQNQSDLDSDDLSSEARPGV